MQRGTPTIPLFKNKSLKDILDLLPKFPREIAFENIMPRILLSQIAVDFKNYHGRESPNPPVGGDTLTTPCLNYNII